MKDTEALSNLSPDERHVAAFLDPLLARKGASVIVQAEVRVARTNVEVARFARVDEPELFEAAARLAVKIVAACVDNTVGSPYETFLIAAVAHGGARAATRLRIVGDEHDGGEAPTSTGIVEQALRHNEVLLHALLRGTSATNTVLADALERATQRNHALEEQRQKAVDERAQIDERRLEREAEAAKAAGRSQSFRAMLDQFGPAVAMHLGIGGPTSPREQKLDNFLRSIGNDDVRLGMLAQFLTPEEWAALTELAKAVRDDPTPKPPPSSNGASTGKVPS